MNRLFIGIETSREPKITGDRNGGFQVESKWTKSFRNKEERKYYCEVFSGGRFDDYGFDRFPLKIDTEKLQLPVTFYADRKSTKETAFVSFAFRLAAIQFIVSEKALAVMQQYQLPPMTVVACRIVSKKEGAFSGNYFLVGFAVIASDAIDYKQSSFTYLHDEKDHNWVWQDMPPVESEEAYQAFTDEKFCSLVRPKQITLNSRYPFDVVNAREHGVFFSEQLIQALQEQECWLGLSTRNCKLMESAN
ncbi:hypothetical protein [Enterococcus sp. BWR-S5]|uniref:hypothetical protein n=1 Tax=Enterococcus sp. BWR-S5 TaxID=2787714 RepID=UPI001923603D|nr:hypothetical protein [Enterococcus sp. BWR-S5]MBL1225904.1 hypothetical protein [Enterococcus sp. BWR-S5]